MPGVTSVVVETPPGRGAVAVVVVDGPGGLPAVDRLFQAANGRPLAAQPLGAIRFGHWGGPDGEELVVCRTAEATVEVHCHGGHAAVRAVVAGLVEAGCVETAWRDTSVGSIKDEARLALADCTTDRAAAVLLDQLGGALEGAVIETLALIDSGDLVQAVARIDELLARSACGIHLTKPWRVTLAGPPNVGKSSLINALVGYERAIVFDQPGVTRDVVTAAAAVDGWPVELADTAGLRDSGDQLEAAGVALTRDAVAESDLVLLVEDCGDTPPPGERSTDALLTELGLAAPAGLLRVANKVDLAERPPTGVDVAVSATTGAGVDDLVRAIGRALAPVEPPAGAGVPFNRRQAERLGDARAALEQGKVAEAAGALRALLAPGGDSSSFDAESPADCDD